MIKRREIEALLERQPNLDYELMTNPNGTVWAIIIKGECQTNIAIAEDSYTVYRMMVSRGSHTGLADVMRLIGEEERAIALQ